MVILQDTGYKFRAAKFFWWIFAHCSIFGNKETNILSMEEEHHIQNEWRAAHEELKLTINNAITE